MTIVQMKKKKKHQYVDTIIVLTQRFRKNLQVFLITFTELWFSITLQNTAE